MNVHLYAICWNEAPMLGFFFRHYAGLVDRFVIYDNGSTDDSREFLARRPNVEVRDFPTAHPNSFILSAKALQDTCWKESRGEADWVIVTAIDEHLHHARLPEYLAHCKRHGVTYVPALGFQMVSTEFPAPDEHLATTRTVGAPYAMMSKLRVFDPDALEETNFGIGGHGASPVGRLRLPWRDELLLLHYKLLGIDYTHTRSAELRSRLGTQDHAQRWGDHYRPERVDEELAHFADRLVDLTDPRYVPWLDHVKGRWWRRPTDPASRLRCAVARMRTVVTRVPSAARGRVEV